MTKLRAQIQRIDGNDDMNDEQFMIYRKQRNNKMSAIDKAVKLNKITNERALEFKELINNLNSNELSHYLLKISAKK